MRAQTKIGWILLWVLAGFTLFGTAALLAHFGIFHPKNLLPQTCSFGNEVKCEVFYLNQNRLAMTLTNMAKDTMILSNISIAKGTPFACTSSINEYTWVSKASLEVLAWCNFDTVLIPTFKEKLEVDLHYYPPQSGPTFTKTIRGTVFATYNNQTLS